MTHPDSTQRPYLVRAMHEWMTDNGRTPHLVIDAERSGVIVPTEYVRDGKIILNCSHAATRNLVIGNDEVGFEARFGGRPQLIRVPMQAVLGIYARESGEGMLFTDEPPADAAPKPGPDDDGREPPPSGPGGPHLRVVK